MVTGTLELRVCAVFSRGCQPEDDTVVALMTQQLYLWRIDSMRFSTRFKTYTGDCRSACRRSHLESFT